MQSIIVWDEYPHFKLKKIEVDRKHVKLHWKEDGQNYQLVLKRSASRPPAYTGELVRPNGERETAECTKYKLEPGKATLLIGTFTERNKQYRWYAEIKS